MTSQTKNRRKDVGNDTDVVEMALCLTPFESIQKGIDIITDALKEMQTQLLVIMKRCDDHEKALKLKKRRVRTKPATGFASPAQISDELCDFLYIPRGSLVPRTTITRLLSSYIRSHGLHDKSDGRRIIPNDALKKLFRIDDNVELSFFNLQKYIKLHCTRSEKLKPI